ncbi:MAG: ATP-binding protein [Chloroflexota bacterium]|nr:ATP-binding protein [Chloroflexota bacterium]
MPTNDTPPSPYKGLMPYTEADARFFFGRDADRQIITANLYAARLTILYGASGVGKSSLLQAGVAYRLHQQPGRAIVVFNNWHGDPLPELKRAAASEIAQVLQKQIPDLDDLPLHEFLSKSASGLRAPLLIVFDQFEEYFLYHTTDDNPRSFAAEFSRAVNQADCPVNFLISLREEALSKLDLFERRMPMLFDNYLRLEHLDRDATTEAITKPLEVYNQGLPPEQQISVEDALVEATIEQVKSGKVTIGQIGRGRIGPRSDADQADGSRVRVEAPFLQLVLTRLWDEEVKQNSRVLRLSTLLALGGADQIMRTHLDAAMGHLKPIEREVSARVFNFLVTPSGTKIALTARDLERFAETPAGRIQPVLDRLAKSDLRILRPIGSGLSEGAEYRYEIYHDVLASAVLDWRARYYKRSPISKMLILAILAALVAFVVQFLIPPYPEIDLVSGILLALVRAAALVMLNTAALLQVYRWFYRDVSLTARSFSVFAFGGPNAAAPLGVIFAILWYVYTIWPNNMDAINALAMLDGLRFFFYLFTIPETLLFGLVIFAGMRFAGQLTERFFRSFDLGFFGVYFGICGLIAALIVLDVLNLVTDLLPLRLGAGQ